MTLFSDIKNPIKPEDREELPEMTIKFFCCREDVYGFTFGKEYEIQGHTMLTIMVNDDFGDTRAFSVDYCNVSGLRKFKECFREEVIIHEPEDVLDSNKLYICKDKSLEEEGFHIGIRYKPQATSVFLKNSVVLKSSSNTIMTFSKNPSDLNYFGNKFVEVIKPKPVKPVEMNDYYCSKKQLDEHICNERRMSIICVNGEWKPFTEQVETGRRPATHRVEDLELIAVNIDSIENARYISPKQWVEEYGGTLDVSDPYELLLKEIREELEERKKVGRI